MSSRLPLQGGWECGNYLWKYRKDLLIEAEGYHYLIRSRSVRNKSRSRTKNPIAPRCWSISAQYLSSPENLIPIWKLWELTVNLRANGEITRRPEGLYIRQRAIRGRDCASIIPECAFLLAIEVFFFAGFGFVHHCIIVLLFRPDTKSRDQMIIFATLRSQARHRRSLFSKSSREICFAECRPGHLRSDARVCSQDNGPSIFLAPFQATRDGEGY